MDLSNLEKPRVNRFMVKVWKLRCRRIFLLGSYSGNPRLKLSFCKTQHDDVTNIIKTCVSASPSSKFKNGNCLLITFYRIQVSDVTIVSRGLGPLLTWPTGWDPVRLSTRMPWSWGSVAEIFLAAVARDASLSPLLIITLQYYYCLLKQEVLGLELWTPNKSNKVQHG